MRILTIQQADGHLDELAELVEQREEVELVRPGKPSLQIVMKDKIKGTRQAGRYEGKSWYMSDDFNEPLSDTFWLGESDK